ncbi:MAG TPA: hypothetical protein PKH90_01380 [Candidatus Desulfobacillus denitrificans]|nr:hypothetical protein [Candidatus Desulfobacillus denitrificans]
MFRIRLSTLINGSPGKIEPVKVQSAHAHIVLQTLAWILGAVGLRSLALGHQAVLIFSFMIFVLAARAGVRCLVPIFDNRQQWGVLALVAVKALASLVYFNHFFVIGTMDGDVSILGNYGDSSLHHSRALAIANLIQGYSDWLPGRASFMCRADFIYVGLQEIVWVKTAT